MSERMVRQFMEMVAIDSESGNEARMMEYLLKAVGEAGGEGSLDAYGNFIGKFPAKGAGAGKAAILLSCHADTVKPGVGIKPVVENGVVRSSGDTILGADDKAGIAEVLEALRTSTLQPPVEFAVSRQEETGLQGVKNMDFKKLTAKYGFLMDNDTLDTIVIGGPSYWAMDVKVTGRAAHAGMEPEKGINAIAAAAKAIAALKLGRLDHETTANVGVINGGLIRNGVPDVCTFLAECRSANHEKGAKLAEQMVATIKSEIEKAGAKCELTCNNLCRAVKIPESSKAVEIAKQALKKVGVDAKAIFITGFTDASIYNNQGIEMAVVGIGAQNEHTTRECVAVADMEKAVVMLHEAFRICAG
ncbi:MAG TPA: M20/M25/M40 family metallo-hydrolase [Myxococcales bacterium]|jgi:tripeptide aminopeptidase